MRFFERSVLKKNRRFERIRDFLESFLVSRSRDPRDFTIRGLEKGGTEKVLRRSDGNIGRVMLVPSNGRGIGKEEEKGENYNLRTNRRPRRIAWQRETRTSCPISSQGSGKL